MLAVIAMLVLLIACFVAMAGLVVFCAMVIAVPRPHAAPYAPHHVPGAAHAPIAPPPEGR
jgi:hypothetical protein